MRFSLIMATRGRCGEVEAFLESLHAQARADTEVIVVDQNGDDRLAPVVARHADRLPTRRLRSGHANACHARNLGLSVARGDIVGFPDDDCLYPPGLLERVDAAFAADPALRVLTGPAASPEGGLGSGRWRQEGGPITPANAWTSVIEFNLFVRRDAALALGGFDERLGPGTPFGSAEGNDLVLRAVSAGHKAVYDPGQRVVHPDKRMTAAAAERAERYGMGMGFVLRRHRVPPSVWLPFFVRPLGGAVLGATRGDAVAVRHHLGSLRGRWAGFTSRDSAEGVPLSPMAGEQR